MLDASTAHILQRLTVFAVNTGTWTATFALLTVIFVRVYTSLPACLQYFLIQILVDARLFLSVDHHFYCVVYSTLPTLL